MIISGMYRRNFRASRSRDQVIPGTPLWHYASCRDAEPEYSTIKGRQRIGTAVSRERSSILKRKPPIKFSISSSDSPWEITGMQLFMLRCLHIPIARKCCTGHLLSDFPRCRIPADPIAGFMHDVQCFKLRAPNSGISSHALPAGRHQRKRKLSSNYPAALLTSACLCKFCSLAALVVFFPPREGTSFSVE